MKFSYFCRVRDFCYESVLFSPQELHFFKKKVNECVHLTTNPSEFKRIRSKNPENKILFCNEPVQFVTHALKWTRVRVLYPEGITLFKKNF